MQRNVFILITVLLVLCTPVLAAMTSFVDNGDGTVTDTETGLVWQQVGAGPMTWEDALNYCEDLVLAGHDDWRLPNRNEIQCVIDYEAFSPTIDTSIFPGVGSEGYWTSTTVAENTAQAWSVFYMHGITVPFTKTGTIYVRAVRGIQ